MRGLVKRPKQLSGNELCVLLVQRAAGLVDTRVRAPLVIQDVEYHEIHIPYPQCPSLAWSYWSEIAASIPLISPR
jgi:hypothetical protein